MNIEVAVDLLRAMVMTSLVVVAPVLTTAIVIGVLVSLLQSITSIQEQTLTFVPKLFAVSLTLLASSHWMIRTLTEFGTDFFRRLPEMAM